MKRIHKLGGVLLIILSMFVYACEHTQNVGPQGTLPGTFSYIQANILTPKCVNQGCHPGNGAPMSLRAGVSYNALVNAPSAFGIPRVDPGRAANSALYLKLIGTSVGTRMPQGRSPLSSAETDVVRDWINAGALNN